MDNNRRLSYFLPDWWSSVISSPPTLTLFTENIYRSYKSPNDIDNHNEAPSWHLFHNVYGFKWIPKDYTWKSWKTTVFRDISFSENWAIIVQLKPWWRDFKKSVQVSIIKMQHVLLDVGVVGKKNLPVTPRMCIYPGGHIVCHQMWSQTALLCDTWLGRSCQSNATSHPHTRWEQILEINSNQKICILCLFHSFDQLCFCILTMIDTWCHVCLHLSSCCRQTHKSSWKDSHSGSHLPGH